MEKTWKPTATGVLCIAAGTLTIIWALYFILAFSGLSSLPGAAMYGLVKLALILVFVIPGLILGALDIIGGIFALKRKLWGLALAGAIATIFPFFPMGILAIIFVAMGKNEFT